MHPPVVFPDQLIEVQVGIANGFAHFGDVAKTWTGEVHGVASEVSGCWDSTNRSVHCFVPEPTGYIYSVVAKHRLYTFHPQSCLHDAVKLGRAWVITDPKPVCRF